MHRGEHRDYAEEILEYFISDSHQIPDILIHPPPDFEPNLPIDDDGHTPLHWACAMGRVRILKLLLSAGADIFAVNKAGQTALMRSVMFSNNYDVRKFPEMYEHLHKSTLNIDNNNRTVFHHIVDLAMTKNKTHAARYYMETILTRLADYPKELSDIVNFQDEDGETALTLAARCRSKRIVKILIDHSADPKIVNNDGKSAEDYILEDERFRASPGPPSRQANMAFRHLQATHPPPGTPPGYAFAPWSGDRPPLHHSATAQRASTRCVNDMASMLDSLAASYDAELRDKERDIVQAHALLGQIQAEILESQRAVGMVRGQAEGLVGARTKLRMGEGEVRGRMGREYRGGWEEWVRGEEERWGVAGEKWGGEEGQQGDTVMADTAPVPNGLPSSSSHPQPQSAFPNPAQLYAPPPDPTSLSAECASLRTSLLAGRSRRSALFDALVSCQAEAGTSARMGDYRRLIMIGCGGIGWGEVEGAVEGLLEVSKVLFGIGFCLELGFVWRGFLFGRGSFFGTRGCLF